MNILFFTHYTSLYGANRSLINLIEGLKNKKINIFVIVPNHQGDLINWLIEHNITFETISFELSTQVVPKENNFFNQLRVFQYVKRQAFKRLLINIKACIKILPLLKKWNINILYSNSSVISIGWWLKIITNLKYVLHIREMQKAHYGFQPDWGNYLFKKHLNAPNLTITVSKCVKEYYHLKNAKIVYNGVFFRKTIHNFDFQKQHNQVFTFGIIGTIHPNKGQFLVLKAFNELIKNGYNIHLLIAGDGNYTEINDFIQKENLSSFVQILGHVSNPINFFKMIDCNIVCSKHEAMGRVTVEGMLTKTLTIGLNDSGTSELIQNEITGFLFEETSLINCMEKIISLPKQKQETIIENAYQYASKDFTIETYSEHIFNLLKKI